MAWDLQGRGQGIERSQKATVVMLRSFLPSSTRCLPFYLHTLRVVQEKRFLFCFVLFNPVWLLGTQSRFLAPSQGAEETYKGTTALITPRLRPAPLSGACLFPGRM